MECTALALNACNLILWQKVYNVLENHCDIIHLQMDPAIGCTKTGLQVGRLGTPAGPGDHYSRNIRRGYDVSCSQLLAKWPVARGPWPVGHRRDKV
jgi:hypothetical protein